MREVRIWLNHWFSTDGGVPCVMEINTRLSGGVQTTYIALGVNIPNIAVNKLLGIDKAWSFERRSAVVSYVETPMALS